MGLRPAKEPTKVKSTERKLIKFALRSHAREEERERRQSDLLCRHAQGESIQDTCARILPDAFPFPASPAKCLR